MDEEYIFANFNDSDDDEIQQQIKYRFKNRIIYNQPNDFHERFRFTHRQAELLLQALGNKLDAISATNHSISNKQKLLTALRFYASNDFYYSIGDSMGMSANSVCTLVGPLNHCGEFLKTASYGARGHGPLRFQNPEVSASVILACACLQNWLIDNRFEDENDDKEFEENNIEIISNKNDGYNEEPEDNRVEQQIKTFIEFNQLEKIEI